MKFSVFAFSSLMVVLIPAAQIVSNELKESQFEDPYPTNDIDVFWISGIIDLSLFGCIFIELVIAACFFFYLSRKYEIKFQINQVLIHVAMILSISLSRLTGACSEGLSIAISNKHTKEAIESAHMLLPVTQIRYVLIFWAVSLFLYLLYFCFLMALLLQVIEKRKPKENDNENKDAEYL